MAKSTITVRRNGNTNRLTTISAGGETHTFDFPGLTRLEQQGVSETIVDMFCASRGFPLMYGKSAAS